MELGPHAWLTEEQSRKERWLKKGKSLTGRYQSLDAQWKWMICVRRPQEAGSSRRTNERETRHVSFGTNKTESHGILGKT